LEAIAHDGVLHGSCPQAVNEVVLAGTVIVVAIVPNESAMAAARNAKVFMIVFPC
jgi:hypothetical protein